MSVQLCQTSVIFPQRVVDNSRRAAPPFVKLPDTASIRRPRKLCFSMQHREVNEDASRIGDKYGVVTDDATRIGDKDGVVTDDATRIGDKDGVIIVDHGSRREQSNLMLNDLVRMFKSRTGYSIVEPAHMELAKPSISDAFGSCVQQGANRIIISPFFLFPGRHWKEDIPSLARDSALEHPGVSYIVTAPLGLHDLMVDIIQDRISFCLRHAAGHEDECSVCAGTGKCQLMSIGTSTQS